MGFSRQEYWSGLPRPVPRDLPSLGIKPASPVSPALVGGFFTTSITWKALVVNSRALPQVRLASPPPPPGPLPRLCEPDVLSSCQRDGKSWLQAGFRGLLARQCSHSAWHAACVQCCGPGCLSVPLLDGRADTALGNRLCLAASAESAASVQGWLFVGGTKEWLLF